jgi:serine/threonine-protein phosphatase 2A regulatory subunit B
MERQPIKTIPIHEHLRPRLCDTYENDSIFDKFEVVFSGDAENVMTGSYNNNFMIYPTDPDKETEVVLQADKSAFKAKKVGVPTPINKNGKKNGSRANSPAGAGSRMRKETDADQIDFNKKILHMSWHPFEDSIAIAATNNVCYSLGRLWILLTKVCSFLFSQHCNERKNRGLCGWSERGFLRSPTYYTTFTILFLRTLW